MGSTIEHVGNAVPALARWLRRVFWVMGGYIATTGLLVIYIANTGVRSGAAGPTVVLAVAGIASIGWMTAVNFMIRSAFRCALLGLAGLWALLLIVATTGL